MAGKISAEAGALRRGAEAVHGAHGDIVASIRRVQGHLEDLQAAWRGDAAASYGHMLTTWNADAAKLNQVLVQLESALRATERDQAATEEQHQSLIHGLGSMMEGN